MMKSGLHSFRVAGIFMLLLVSKNSYSQLVVPDSASLTVNAGVSITVEGDLTLGSRASIVGTGAVRMKGSGAQTINGAGKSISGLIIENNADVTIVGSKSISRTLTLTAGNVITGTDTLFIDSGAVINRTSGHIIGYLNKSFEAGTDVANTFDIGNGSDYLPATITFPLVSTHGSVTMSTRPGDHPQLSSSGFIAGKTLNRGWTIGRTGVLPNNYNLTLNYLDDDNDPGVDPSKYRLKAYSDSVWSTPVSPDGTPGNTTSTFNGISLSGELQIGEFEFATLNLTLFLEGFYAGAHTMSPALFNGKQSDEASVVGAPTNTEVDTVTVQLHSAVAPFAMVSSQNGVLNTNGTLQVNFPQTSGDYYIVIKTRNHLQTWSAVPVTISGITSYDFSSDATKAYGGNMVNLGGGRFGIYAGDINQDEFVDISDYPPLDNDNNSFRAGFLVTDLNGDGFSDVSDYPVLDRNNNNFIGSATLGRSTVPSPMPRKKISIKRPSSK